MINLILYVSNINYTLNVIERLKLTNELFLDAGVQEKMIKWKKSINIYCQHESLLGTVGKGYWRKLLKYHCHGLRANSTRHLNSTDIFNHITHVFVNESIITMKYDASVKVDNNGNLTEDKDISSDQIWHWSWTKLGVICPKKWTMLLELRNFWLVLRVKLVSQSLLQVIISLDLGYHGWIDTH